MEAITCAAAVLVSGTLVLLLNLRDRSCPCCLLNAKFSTHFLFVCCVPGAWCLVRQDLREGGGGVGGGAGGHVTYCL